MSLYEGIKDVANVVRKADNIELYQQLLDLGQVALDMQEEIRQLIQENNELKKKQDFEDRIERHDLPYFTLKGEDPNIRYCSTCWGTSGKRIQLDCFDDGSFICPNCKYEGEYNRPLHRKTQEDFWNRINSIDNNIDF